MLSDAEKGALLDGFVLSDDDFRGRAEHAARVLLAEVEIEAVADAVAGAVLALDQQELRNPLRQDALRIHLDVGRACPASGRRGELHQLVSALADDLDDAVEDRGAPAGRVECSANLGGGRWRPGGECAHSPPCRGWA